MLKKHHKFADKTVFYEKRFRKTDTRVEVKVGHRERLFEYVPKTFLGVKQVKICVPRQSTLGETLSNGNLKFYVGIVFGNRLPDRGTEYKIVVFVEGEIWTVVECFSDTVGIDFGVGGYNLSLHRCGSEQKC